MDALPSQHPDAGAVARVRAALAPLGPSPWDALSGSPFSFIRPSNVVSLDAWRLKRRAAR